MAVQEDLSFLEYTSAWISRVNRGGLFELNDTAYRLFKEFELEIWISLPSHLKRNKTANTSKESLIPSVINKKKVQIHWYNLCTDMHDTTLAIELL